MQIRSAKFITSAAQPKQFLRRPIPHVVFAGKSNVGKSSLLNGLLNRNGLAKTSSTPGKTRLVNYFLINDQFFFVDVPGYGYAKVRRTEQAGWGKLMENYFTETPFIAVVFLLIDIRRDPNENDVQMIDFLIHNHIPFRILLTKADKFSKNQATQQRNKIAEALCLPRDELIATSAEKGTGIKEVWKSIQLAFDGMKNRKTEEEAL